MYPNNNNNNNNNNSNLKKKDKNQKEGGRRRERGARRESDKIFIFFSLFLSQIYGNRTVNFCQSRSQSWSTRRELRVGTDILPFRQTSRGRKFSYLCYFEPKGYVMTWNFLRARERP